MPGRQSRHAPGCAARQAAAVSGISPVLFFDEDDLKDIMPALEDLCVEKEEEAEPAEAAEEEAEDSGGEETDPAGT